MSWCAETREADAWGALDTVNDPEVPVLSVVDLGIVRQVRVSDTGDSVEVTVTPTYSGCPALEVIERDIAAALGERFAEVTVRTVLAPAWTTDWISDRGRERLREAGIAPPGAARASAAAAARRMSPIAVVGGAEPAAPACPRCGSEAVERISEFGSTACKSLWRCRSCAEPFDHFKPL